MVNKIIPKILVILILILAYPIILHFLLKNVQNKYLTWVFFLQFSLWQLLLAWIFFRTLSAKKTPLISSLAAIFHGDPLPTRIARYTYTLTLVWGIYFLLQFLISTILFAFYPIDTWSFFTNVLFFPFLAVFFIVEYLFRRIWLAEFEHAKIHTGVTLYFKNKIAIEKPFNSSGESRL